MSVDTLIRAALDAGVQLVWANGKVNVIGKGRSSVIKPVLERLRAHKAAIEQHLRAQVDDDKPTPPEVITKASEVIRRVKQPWLHADAGWREASKAYYQHHVNCPQCQGASQGRGHRCAPGLELWLTYEAELERTPHAG